MTMLIPEDLDPLATPTRDWTPMSRPSRSAPCGLRFGLVVMLVALFGVAVPAVPAGDRESWMIPLDDSGWFVEPPLPAVLAARADDQVRSAPTMTAWTRAVMTVLATCEAHPVTAPTTARESRAAWHGPTRAEARGEYCLGEWFDRDTVVPYRRTAGTLNDALAALLVPPVHARLRDARATDMVFARAPERAATLPPADIVALLEARLGSDPPSAARLDDTVEVLPVSIFASNTFVLDQVAWPPAAPAAAPASVFARPAFAASTFPARPAATAHGVQDLVQSASALAVTGPYFSDLDVQRWISVGAVIALCFVGLIPFGFTVLAPIVSRPPAPRPALAEASATARAPRLSPISQAVAQIPAY